ncbi:MAG: ATP-dependent zinc protease [Gloeobacteraceae cyanobacterium ES-bin-144]|nr:ATP-dependent zinc protease [Verrucomicrobiales bacterium]
MSRTYKAVPEVINLPSSELAAEMGLPATSSGAPRLIIGRREWLALPDLGLFPLNAKTDSGARSSSLHAENITLSPDQSTVRFTTFNFHGTATECETEVIRFGRVRSSTGLVQKRIFIQTTAHVSGNFRWTILVSLTNRADMHCSLLLGRRALAGFFLIDPLGTHLLGTRRQLEQSIL